jgi:hypothetical protein
VTAEAEGRTFQVAKCPRCARLLREVETTRMFTRHAACLNCNILFVLWGTTMTRCLTPKSCAGNVWKVLPGEPQRKPHTRRAPGAIAK